MPPKSKRQRQLEDSLLKGREEIKRQKLDKGTSYEGQIEEDDVGELFELAQMSEEALDTEDETVDPSFDLDSSMKSDYDHKVEEFCEEWVLQLDRDDKVSLGLFLCFQLSSVLGLKETKAAEFAGLMIGRSDKSVREWKKNFFK